MLLAFSKYHGLGNDFAFVDARDLDITFPGQLSQKICDRYRGVGADGVLVWTGTLNEPEMTVINADGGIAHMSGNALRCFVKHVLDRHLPQINQLDVLTGIGQMHCAATRDENGSVVTVTVRMGSVQVAPVAIPVDLALANAPVQLRERAVTVTAVKLDAPHVVTFDKIADDERAAIAPLLEHHPLLPEPANVAFAQLLPGGPPRMQVDVYARGSGWTTGSGTGALAAAIVAVESGRMPRDREIAVKLKGGWVSVRVGEDNGATMRGPAVHVYDGTINIPRLLAGEA